MTRLILFSLNARGLNSPHKRVGLLDVLEREKVDIAMVSESHLLQRDIYSFHNRHYHVLSSSSTPNKTKGVLIVARRSLQFTNLGTGGDLEGITFIKTIIANRKIAFVSIYAPNSFDPNFYTQLTELMFDLVEYLVNFYLQGVSSLPRWAATSH
uniref:Endonuclease/exonuclease/phosphatase domain-containing protein n=1 Tax=Myripristis murdjan TaxID=586833 RepID=A0A667XZT6_9TELE